MKAYAIAYLATLITFLGIDFVWLARMADVLYRPAMGDMVLDRFRLAPALVFYLAFAAGLVHFAVRPALASADWTTALLNGALLGLAAYGTYDLTNQATLRNWTTLLTCADMAWGTVLCAASAVAGFLVTVALTRGA